MVYVDVDGDATTFCSSTRDADAARRARPCCGPASTGAATRRTRARNTVRFATPATGYADPHGGAARRQRRRPTRASSTSPPRCRRPAAAPTAWPTCSRPPAPNMLRRLGAGRRLPRHRAAAQPGRRSTATPRSLRPAPPSTLSGDRLPHAAAGPGEHAPRRRRVRGRPRLHRRRLRAQRHALSDAVESGDQLLQQHDQPLGATFTAKNPNYVNQLGFDADLLDRQRRAAQRRHARRSASRSNGDRYYPGVVTFATDLYAPGLRAATASPRRSPT